METMGSGGYAIYTVATYLIMVSYLVVFLSEGWICYILCVWRAAFQNLGCGSASDSKFFKETFFGGSILLFYATGRDASLK